MIGMMCQHMYVLSGSVWAQRHVAKRCFVFKCNLGRLLCLWALLLLEIEKRDILENEELESFYLECFAKSVERNENPRM